MKTWYQMAKAEIAIIHANLPETATLAERKHALRPENRPYQFVVTSWGRKQWQRAQREYLARYGAKSDSEVPRKHLSPLERMMAKSGVRT